jgi:hypothetical protein
MLSLKSTAKHRQIVLKLLTGQCCSLNGIQFNLRVIGLIIVDLVKLKQQFFKMSPEHNLLTA